MPAGSHADGHSELPLAAAHCWMMKLSQLFGGVSPLKPCLPIIAAAANEPDEAVLALCSSVTGQRVVTLSTT
jgi:hypothetical protein